MLSREADLVPIDAPEAADAISGVLGELSSFDSTHGYHADGVDLQTSILPSGWQERLIRIENENTNGYVGLCLELHDLLLSKYFAGREKDHEYCRAVMVAGLASSVELTLRLAKMEISEVDRQRIAARIALDSES